MRIHSGGRKSIRVRCQHDAQGRECPDLHACAFEHWLPPNTRRFQWILGGTNETAACFKGVGVWFGVGRSWAYQHGLFRGGVVCGGGDDDWYISGPIGGVEWRRKHAAGDRRRGSNTRGSASSRAVITTPGTAKAGEHTGRKRRGKKARERLRRRIASSRLDRPCGGHDRAAAASTTTIADQQGQLPSAASADGGAAAGGHGELTGLLSQGRRIIVANFISIFNVFSI
mmetsp:Transcript_42532/g.62504  ORF Transcript_42532/g.62504 Transcript_42532/m.62504 type:complete len:228 (-) Transcript_42532:57-740(-)